MEYAEKLGPASLHRSANTEASTAACAAAGRDAYVEQAARNTIKLDDTVLIQWVPKERPPRRQGKRGGERKTNPARRDERAALLSKDHV
ncbi:hypothetical protein MTO96_049687 [Rhipicephalus appendiculatus]